MPEALYTCPRCGTPNFSARGLTSHHCRAGGERSRLTPLELSNALSMSQSTSAPVVVVTPGQPSAEVLAKLSQVGAQLTDEQLVTAINAVESARVGFATEAVAAGVLLLAKKQSLKHGEWLPWCEQFGTALMAKLETRFQFGAAPTTRALRHYTFLAQHFLADLEHNSFVGDDRDARVEPPAVTTEEVVSLERLDQDRRVAVYQAITQFVAGRSLRRMLSDFRRAESAADQEQAQHEAEAAKKGTRKGKETPGQLDFWDELNRPLSELDTLMKSPDFVERTTREGWLKLAAELSAKAKEAKDIAARMK